MLKKILLLAVFTVFNFTQIEAQYCTASSTDPAFFIDDFFTTGAPVDISNLNSGFSTGGYGDFTGLAVTQVAGGTINFSVVSGNGPMRPNIWVDWNNDFDFDDAGEEVYNAGPANVTTTDSFVVPGGTANGNYRMRVRSDRNAANVASCGFDDRSEAEDYTLIVGTPPNCVSPVTQPTALTFGTITASSISASFTAAAADSYLVLMNITGTPPTAPTNGINYPIGDNSLGATVVDNDSNLAFTASALTASTQYYFFVYAFNNTNCINGPAYNNTTAPLTGNDTTTSTTYCTPAAGPPGTEFIDLFETTGGVTNFSNATGYTPGGYTDYTATHTVSQYPGQDIEFLGNFDSFGGMGAGVWIDLNNDGDFADANEEIFNSSAYIAGFTFIYSVPPGLAVGTYRIRVLGDWWLDTPTPCGFDPAGPEGEAEDYTLEVLPLPCGDDPSNITISAITGTTATVSWNAAVPAPGTGYEYLVTTNTNPPNFNLPGTGTTNSATTSVNVTGLSTGTTYYVWVRSICGGGNGSGQWIGPEVFATPAIPPTVTNVTICTGEASQDLTASGSCSVTVNLGSSLTGAIDAATSPVALNPDLPILGGGSEPNCGFTAGTSTYDAIDFSVDVTGVYIFTLATPVPYFDAMGYLVLGDGLFVPGSCATGTWILGDDDSGPALQPSLTVTLTAGVNYTLITSEYGSGVTHTGPYTWNMTGPGSLFGGSGGVIQWYDAAVGGNLVGTGTNFDPVAAGEIADTNTAGTWSYWAACSGSPATRTQADFVINETPSGTIDGRGSSCDASVNMEIVLTGTAPWTFTYTNGTTPVTVTNFAGPSPYAFSVVPNASDVYTLTALTDASGCTGNLFGTVTFSGDKVWDGSTNTDWATASNWTPVGVPTNSDAVIVPVTGNDPIISGLTNAEGCSLRIENGASLTLDDNTADANYASLTITNDINLEANSVLRVQNNSSLVQINESTPNVNNNSGTGVLIMDREANISRTDYVYWSSPVSNFSLSNIYGGDTPVGTYRWNPTIPNGTISVPPSPCVFANIPICFGDWELYNGNMAIGKGYISNGPTSQGVVASNYLTSITGTIPNNGIITHPITSGNNSPTYCSFQYQPNGNDFVTVTPFDDNWNLIGNPYPSAISANAFINYSNGGVDNTLVEGAVHIWTHGTDANAGNVDPFYDDFALNYNPNDYLTHNLAGTNVYPNETTSTDYFIGSGQGFFVLALNDNETGSVTFSNTMRDISYDNSSFYRSTNDNSSNENEVSIERHRIWLNLSHDNEQTSSIMVGYIEGATQAKDRAYDAYTFQTNTMSIYSLIDDERMIIQGRQLPFDENDQIPLGIDILQEGNYTISISGVDGLFEGVDAQDIYLEDTYDGIIHDLKQSPFTFNSSEGSYIDRFVLRYTNNQLNVGEFDFASGIKVYEDNTDLVIKSYNESIHSVEVFDILGRRLFVKKSVYNSILNITSIPKGETTLFLKIKLIDGSETIEKIIF